MDSGEKIRYISQENPSSQVVGTFVKAIRDHGQSPVSAKESYEAMRVVSAIEESARTGAFINL